jgi:hypothetical protein
MTIPAGVTTIGEGAFFQCSGLTSVTISAGVTSIGDSVFYQCSGLASVTVLRETEPLTTLGRSVFLYGSNSLRIYVPAAKVDAYKALANWSTYASKIDAISE